jgi:chromosome segregation ATPase
METRDQYVDDLKKKLNEWNEQIGKMQEQMGAASDEVRNRYEQQIEEMQAYREDAEKRMTALMESSAADWEKMRHQFEDAWGDIAAGFGRAWSRFR